MGARNRTNDVEAQPCSLDLFQPAALNTVKPPEDALQLFARNSNTTVLHANPHGIGRRRRYTDRDPDDLTRILDRVVEEVDDDGAQFLGVAANHQRTVVV